jgi:hypothetical protein
MKEQYEFRVFSDVANAYLDIGEGKDLGSVRQCITYPGEQLFEKIRTATQEESKKGNPAYAGWQIKRTYSALELSQAELFRFWPNGKVSPGYNDTSVSYDESTACPMCHSDGHQIRQLEINLEQKKTTDFLRLFSGELVFSDRAVEVFSKAQVTGISFCDVLKTGRNRAKIRTGWQQMLIASSSAEISTQTEVGSHPFGEARIESYGCKDQHIIGLNLISEVYVERSTWNKSDVVATSKHIGVRVGLFRPARIVLCSPKFREVVLKNEIKGCSFEVCRLV